jgi:hypothetical protein
MSERTAKRLWNRVLVERQKAAQTVANGSGINLADAGASHCRFICGDARSMTVCGEQVVIGRSWCPDHLRRVMAD